LPPPPPPGQTAALLRQAEGEFVNGNSRRARDIAHRILAVDPHHQKAIRLSVIASCSVGEKNEAQIYFDRLAARNEGLRRAAASICKRYGVTLVRVP
jgi:hypothetical protein